MLRRRLLHWLGALGLLPWAPRKSAAAEVRELNDSEKELLRAVAAAVLPRSLGRERTDAIANGLLSWLRGYRAGADRGHGYGVTRLATAPASPAAGYPLQLAALERAAREGGSTGFGGLAADDQRTLLDAALQAARVERLPDRPDGRHVAADLMAFFFRSSEANDLCYRAEIGRDTCRGLADSAEAPRSLGAAAPAGRTAPSAPRGGDGS
jgi:hypothetical protein